MHLLKVLLADLRNLDIKYPILDTPEKHENYIYYFRRNSNMSGKDHFLT